MIRYFILVIVFSTFLVACSSDLPPEPNAPGVAGNFYLALYDWATTPSTFFVEKDRIVCSSDEIVSLDYYVDDEFVYNEMFLWRGSEWVSVSLSGEVTDSNWLRGYSRYTISASCTDIKDTYADSNGDIFALAYSCRTSSSGNWDCHGNKWQMQIASIEVCTGTVVDGVCIELPGDPNGPGDVCVEEGESLGGVFPDNTAVCCPGLVEYNAEPMMLGRRGNCVNPDTMVCPAEYDPVCASPPFDCPDQFLCAPPIDITYTNYCEMIRAGATFVSEGACGIVSIDPIYSLDFGQNKVYSDGTKYSFSFEGTEYSILRRNNAFVINDKSYQIPVGVGSRINNLMFISTSAVDMYIGYAGTESAVLRYTDAVLFFTNRLGANLRLDLSEYVPRTTGLFIDDVFVHTLDQETKVFSVSRIQRFDGVWMVEILDQESNQVYRFRQGQDIVLPFYKFDRRVSIGRITVLNSDGVTLSPLNGFGQTYLLLDNDLTATLNRNSNQQTSMNPSANPYDIEVKDNNNNLLLFNRDGKVLELPFAEALNDDNRRLNISQLRNSRNAKIFFSSPFNAQLNNGDVTVYATNINIDNPIPSDCDSTMICAPQETCVDGKLYPTTCGPENCDKPIDSCGSSEIPLDCLVWTNGCSRCTVEDGQKTRCIQKKNCISGDDPWYCAEYEAVNRIKVTVPDPFVHWRFDDNLVDSIREIKGKSSPLNRKFKKVSFGEGFINTGVIFENKSYVFLNRLVTTWKNSKNKINWKEDDWTISLKFKPTGQSHFALFDLKNDNTNMFVLRYRDGSLEFFEEYKRRDTGTFIRSSPVDFSDDWQHLVVTKEKLEGSNNLFSFYLNNELILEEEYSIRNKRLNKFVLGYAKDHDRYFVGSMDELQIWKSVLSEDQIAVISDISNISCDQNAICGMAATCVDGMLYPTTCGPENCDAPIDTCDNTDYCDPSMICGPQETCVDGMLYPTTCGPENCDAPIDSCGNSDSPSLVPLLRAYNSEIHNHFYTTNKSEMDVFTNPTSNACGRSDHEDNWISLSDKTANLVGSWISGWIYLPSQGNWFYTNDTYIYAGVDSSLDGSVWKEWSWLQNVWVQAPSRSWIESSVYASTRVEEADGFWYYLNESLPNGAYTFGQGWAVCTSGNTMQYRFEGVAGYIYQAPVEGTVPLLRAYNSEIHNHFYTTNKSEMEMFTSSTPNACGRSDHEDNWISLSDKTANLVGSWISGWVYLPSQGNWFYTNDTYIYAGVDSSLSGSIWKEWSWLQNVWVQAPSRSWIESSVYASTRVEEADGFWYYLNESLPNGAYTFGQGWAVCTSGNSMQYRFEGIVGYVHPSLVIGSVQLYRAYHPELQNHFYTTNRSEMDNAINNLGYTFEGVAGYIYVSPEYQEQDASICTQNRGNLLSISECNGETSTVCQSKTGLICYLENFRDGDCQGAFRPRVHCDNFDMISPTEIERELISIQNALRQQSAMLENQKMELYSSTLNKMNTLMTAREIDELRTEINMRHDSLSNQITQQYASWKVELEKQKATTQNQISSQSSDQVAIAEIKERIVELESGLRQHDAMVHQLEEQLASLNEQLATKKPCGILGVNKMLLRGESIYSCNGKYSFIFQDDGNVVLYNSDRRAVWNLGTYNSNGAFLHMQADGNLVVYDKSNNAVKATMSFGKDPSGLYVQDDGNLVIYGSDPRVIWNSGTQWN